MQQLKEKSLIILDCDLRINDNPALFNGIKNHQETISVCPFKVAIN